MTYMIRLIYNETPGILLEVEEGKYLGVLFTTVGKVEHERRIGVGSDVVAQLVHCGDELWSVTFLVDLL